MPVHVARKPLSDQRGLAQALYVQGFGPAVISQKTGVKRETVSTWAKRFKWTAVRDNLAEETAKACKVVVSNSLERESERMRSQFAGILSNHVSSLAQVPAKANLGHIQKVGQAIEPLARTAKAVFDWGNKVELGLIVAGEMTQAIDIEAEPTQPQAITEHAITSDGPAQQESPAEAVGGNAGNTAPTEAAHPEAAAPRGAATAV